MGLSIVDIAANMGKSGRTPEQQAARDARKAAKKAAEAAAAAGAGVVEESGDSKVEGDAPEGSKRKRNDEEEGDLLEIDLSAATPMSKAEARAARKKAKRGEVDEPKTEAAGDDKPKREKKPKVDKPVKQNSIWIGNLSFRTTSESLKTFLEQGVVELGGESDSVTRVNLPKKEGRGTFAENRG